ncbi:bifunctional DNA primase/polymerase [Virgibacillus proomii]|uniref:bifunctional DNA primase/polymerase n=1 Tax=Virgibacillus proomii TaxID=84407 RepID=UPI0015C391FB|nr:bifunctional DNA primase/polymerase [Virgibacillus proomii]
MNNNKKGVNVAASTPSQESTNLKAALAYSEMLNWSVFPIHYKSKVPITQHGFKDATTDENQLIEWWTRYPHAGIGLPTGKINNLVVLDVDPRNNGIYSLDRLIDEYEPFPYTVECLTGGGGNHYYFRYDERIKKSHIPGFEGIDIQSDGKYVVLPPSTHPSGRKYYWEESSKPVVNPIADMPNWLIDQLKQNQTNTNYNARSIEDYLMILQGVPDGNRNNSMMTLIGYLLGKGIDYRVAYMLVLLWNENNDPPLDKNIVTKAFNNILRKEASRRLTHDRGIGS